MGGGGGWLHRFDRAPVSVAPSSEVSLDTPRSQTHKEAERN